VLLCQLDWYGRCIGWLNILTIVYKIYSILKFLILTLIDSTILQLILLKNGIKIWLIRLHICYVLHYILVLEQLLKLLHFILNSLNIFNVYLLLNRFKNLISHFRICILIYFALNNLDRLLVQYDVLFLVLNIMNLFKLALNLLKLIIFNHFLFDGALYFYVIFGWRFLFLIFILFKLRILMSFNFKHLEAMNTDLIQIMGPWDGVLFSLGLI